MSAPLKLALFGTPIKTSLSPFIHAQFAQQAGLEIDYRLIDTGPAQFPQLLELFRLSGGVGCNITLPLKRDAWQLSASASAHVLEAQAANTLVLQPSNDWMAYTTDGTGLLTDLKVNHGLKIEGQRILILGAGGAVAGIMSNLLDQNPATIVVANRNLERARNLIAQFKNASLCSAVSWQEAAKLPAFNLVINATSLGHQGQAPALSRSMFAEDAVCYDLNYFKASQPLKLICEQHGITFMDGLGMLVEQAASSFFLWTGFQAQTAPLIKACLSKLPGPA